MDYIETRLLLLLPLAFFYRKCFLLRLILPGAGKKRESVGMTGNWVLIRTKARAAGQVCLRPPPLFVAAAAAAAVVVVVYR